MNSVYERDHVLVEVGSGFAEDAATIGHNFGAVIADLETRMREAAATSISRKPRACATRSSACARPNWRWSMIPPCAHPPLEGEGRRAQRAGVG
jgi:hypothetical protein